MRITQERIYRIPVSDLEDYATTVTGRDWSFEIASGHLIGFDAAVEYIADGKLRNSRPRSPQYIINQAVREKVLPAGIIIVDLRTEEVTNVN